jgi:predicted unusual protein kinase regulating ubiquinone biosynthesis (AarF/ABC1/UbiB family)
VFQKDKTEVGKWMKDEFGNLGPAFVKFGQFLSTRQDLFGKEVAEQLKLLQDDINPVTYDEIAAIIESELKKPLEDVFSSLETNYIGTASIGQVHKGTLKKSGNQVVIKVQKPYISEQVTQNLDTLKQINGVFAFFGSPRAPEFDQIISQYERFLSAELDYENELNNMVLFYNKLSDLPVRIPKVYTSLSTKKVLVMEYVPSLKITEVEVMLQRGYDTLALCDTLVKLFLSQIIEKGIVHNDTQQGNIGVLDDGKTIVLYDFGNVITFSSDFRDSIGMIVFSVAQKDIDEFVDMLVRLKILYVDEGNDIYEVKAFFAYFFKYLDGLDINALKASILQSDIEGKFQENLNINPDFLSLFRVFTLLDGTISILDPNYSYIDALQPYTQSVFNDPKFLDMRARKDFMKLGMYPRALQNSDSNIIRVQTKVVSIKKDIQMLKQYVIMALLLNVYFTTQGYSNITSQPLSMCALMIALAAYYTVIKK